MRLVYFTDVEECAVARAAKKARRSGDHFAALRLRCVEAAFAGRGVRLSPEEVESLFADEAFEQAASHCFDDYDSPEGGS